MCCFSRPVERVEQTRIYARADGARQLVVYELKLAAKEDLAMVLPVPVPEGSPEDAIEFVDLSSSPTFFAALEYAFAPPEKRLKQASRGAPQSRALAVQRVGAFDASFVPRAADFDRLDPRFSIPSALWARVPAVRGFGFVVFRMRRDPADSPPRGLLERVFGGGEPETPLHAFHPMAFWFPRADTSHVFFPTLHVHDGDVHDHARFDHVLYVQRETPLPSWERSSQSFQDGLGGVGRTLVLPAPGHRWVMRGKFPNADTWIDG
jgi:hypothetical protein